MNRKKRKSSSKGRCRLPLHAYLAYLLVCTLLLTGVSFSRYLAVSNAGDSARVAAGGITVTGDGDPLTLSQTDPAASYGFTVSSPSEVAIRYDVVVTLGQALPSGVTMQLDGNSSSSGSVNQYTFSDVGTFAAGSPSSNGHTLNFSCSDFAASAEDYTTAITITVRAEQID